MPEMFFDYAAAWDGLRYGLLLGLVAGGSGWTIRLCLQMFRNISG